jgi:hypothetical protein
MVCKENIMLEEKRMEARGTSPVFFPKRRRRFCV